jgi:hypothetical protein
MKYSIIIPSHNGMEYLPSCVESVLSQDYDDFELILSDDHSTDGTGAFVGGIAHPRVRAIHAPRRMSMAEHWEWALGHANGEWLAFVGQDDGLQPYFFSLAERLTSLATKKRIRAIMSRRAYFFWHGCEGTYGDTAASYDAEFACRTMISRYEAFKALIGYQDYFELPAMYTTSLFRRGLIEEARRKQDGVLLVTHPQDANLAAVACSLERRYLHSDAPLGWVGSSTRSAGLSVAVDGDESSRSLRSEYLRVTEGSGLAYNDRIGSFSFGSAILYFFGALHETGKLRGGIENRFLASRFMRRLVLAAARNEMRSRGQLDSPDRVEQLKRIARSNGLSYTAVSARANRTLPMLVAATRMLERLFGALRRALRIVAGGSMAGRRMSLRISRKDSPSLTLMDAQEAIHGMVAAHTDLFH